MPPALPTSLGKHASATYRQRARHVCCWLAFLLELDRFCRCERWCMRGNPPPLRPCPPPPLQAVLFLGPASRVPRRRHTRPGCGGSGGRVRGCGAAQGPSAGAVLQVRRPWVRGGKRGKGLTASAQSNCRSPGVRWAEGAGLALSRVARQSRHSVDRLQPTHPLRHACNMCACCHAPKPSISYRTHTHTHTHSLSLSFSNTEPRLGPPPGLSGDDGTFPLGSGT